MNKPFAGIRILDFTRYVAGPFGTYQLALLGAEVIKIEPKAGDDMRHSQLSPEWAAKGWALLSRHQRQQAQPDPRPVEAASGRDRRSSLASRADVVWENFRPGIMDRFGSATRRCARSTRA